MFGECFFAIQFSYVSMRKKRTRQYFVQGCGTYTNQILVVVGYTPAETAALMRRKKFHKYVINEYEKDHKDEPEDRGLGACWFHDGASVIWFPQYENTWNFWETLIHEIFHFVHFMGEQRNMEDEDEALAYLQEYLFRQIRRKLMGATKP